LLAAGFAVGVERAVAYDTGYSAASDEIDVLEAFGGYPRAHLSRFASLYTTGRIRFTISYPNDPSALAMPQDNGRSVRGEDVATVSWRSQPFPALEGLNVQPRSISLFRAEQMVEMAGAIRLDTTQNPPRVVNGSEIELRDAVVIDVDAEGEKYETVLGTIKPGQSVELKQSAGKPSQSDRGALDLTPVMRNLAYYREDLPENRGEMRLVAWTPKVVPGQMLDPPVDRRRGVTAVVVHLKYGPPPSPDGPSYDRLNPEAKPATVRVPTPEIGNGQPPQMNGVGRGPRFRAMPRRGGPAPGLGTQPAANPPARDETEPVRAPGEESNRP
jgi:hypothetical protein